MSEDIKIVKPGHGKWLVSESGSLVTPPAGWEFMPAGDAGITRKITAKNKYWRVQVKKGKRLISKGVWAPAEIIALAKRDMEATKANPAYQKKLEKGRERRAEKQVEYEQEFLSHVIQFLSFAPIYKELEKKMAKAITKHSVPVGSGTVARTSMIPVQDRAARAVIAWMRHQTTAYDSMHIPLIKGKRREVRKGLAKDSSALLKSYREGVSISEKCPLKHALRD